MTDDSVSVKFGADASGIKQGAQEAQSAISKMAEGIKSSFAGLSGTDAALKNMGASAKTGGQDAQGAFDKVKSTVEGLTLGVGAMAAAAGAYLMKVANDATALGEAIKKAAGDANQSFVTMSEMKSVADRSGLAVDALGTSFQKMQEKAGKGDEATVHALNAIGLTAKDVAGLTESQLTVKLAGGV